MVFGLSILVKLRKYPRHKVGTWWAHTERRQLNVIRMSKDVQS